MNMPTRRRNITFLLILGMIFAAAIYLLIPVSAESDNYMKSADENYYNFQQSIVHSSLCPIHHHAILILGGGTIKWIPEVIFILWWRYHCWNVLRLKTNLEFTQSHPFLVSLLVIAIGCHVSARSSSLVVDKAPSQQMLLLLVTEELLEGNDSKLFPLQLLWISLFTISALLTCTFLLFTSGSSFLINPNL